MIRSDVDREVLAAAFAARVQLAKKTEVQVVQESRTEWKRTQQWVKSESHKEGSFLWFCDEFDLDPGAVRRAIKERAK